MQKKMTQITKILFLIMAVSINSNAANNYFQYDK